MSSRLVHLKTRQ